MGFRVDSEMGGVTERSAPGHFRFKLTMKLLFAVLTAMATVSGAEAVPTLNVAYSDDASASMTAVPGDQFFLSGNSGSILLTSGVAADINAISISEGLGCCWDDALYQTNVHHTLTLNGATGAFDQTWSVWDYIGPTTGLSGAGPLVYTLPSGSISVTSLGGNGFGGTQGTATLLYTANVVPEPSTLPLLGAALLAFLFLQRRRRRSPVA
jgi:hypothetical protein